MRQEDEQRDDGFKAKKSLGQNFLTNPLVPKWMADAANLQQTDTVLEIGPGTGMLTREFLRRGARVIAVEADERAVVLLTDMFEHELACGQLVLEHNDIREVDLSKFGLKQGSFKLIANIPYYLSGILFRMFLSGDCQPSMLVFLTQKEVAERIARDTKESLLSLSVKAYGAPQYVKTVSRGNFNPAPNVDSAIIAVSHISKGNFQDLDEMFFFELLHLGFSAKRKQLLGNLAKKFNRGTLTEIFSTLSIPLATRGEDIPLTTWLTLAASLAIHR